MMKDIFTDKKCHLIVDLYFDEEIFEFFMLLDILTFNNIFCEEEIKKL